MIPIIIADKKIDFSNMKENICYILDKGGIKLFRRNDNFECLAEVDEISHLEEVEKFVKVRNFIKFPYSVLTQAIDFFRIVYNKFKTEAVLMIIMNNETKKYSLYCPEQEVSGAACKWKGQLKIPQGWHLAGTIHSHADMSAFFSSADDEDDSKFDGLHMVLGNMDERVPTLACSYVAGGERQEMSMEDTCFEDGFKLKAPADWIKMVSEKKYEYKYDYQNNTKVNTTVTSLNSDLPGQARLDWKEERDKRGFYDRYGHYHFFNENFMNMTEEEWRDYNDYCGCDW